MISKCYLRHLFSLRICSVMDDIWGLENTKMCRMKNTSLFGKITMLIVLLAIAGATSAKVVYVDTNIIVNKNNSLVNCQSGLQYPSIQAAIDAVIDGDAIILAAGIFRGDGNRDLNFKGKSITICSTDPNDPNIVAETIIDCNGTKAEPHRGFCFNKGEDLNSILSGLTIKNGYAKNGGGILCEGSGPIITKCTISGNTAYNGGGIYCDESSQPMITSCTIKGNLAVEGGGICCSGNTLIKSCIISSNRAISYTRPLGDLDGNCRVDFKDIRIFVWQWLEPACLVLDCIADLDGVDGVNMADIALLTASWGIEGWKLWAEEYTATNYSTLQDGDGCSGVGGGILCKAGQAIIKNCTIIGNSAKRYVGGIYCEEEVSPKITNCILWNNTDSTGTGLFAQVPSPVDGSLTVSHCCIQDWTKNFGGIGNTDDDPCFIDPGYWDPNGTPADANDDFWIEGDYHLLVYSSCIESGDPYYCPAHLEKDIDGDMRLIGDRVDMGSDEFLFDTPFIGVSSTDFMFVVDVCGPNPEAQILSIRNIGVGTITWTITEDCPWLGITPSTGESSGQSVKVTVSVDTSFLSRGIYNCQFTINSAEAINNPKIIPVTLRINATLHVPAEFNRIQEAINVAIDGDIVLVADGMYIYDSFINFNGKSITVCSENGPNNCIIDLKYFGGCAFFFDHTGETQESVIDGFTIRNGTGLHDDKETYGGAIYCEEASITIRNCIITNNSVSDEGGGIYCEDASPMIVNCIISGNSAGEEGGGIYFWGGRPTIENCTMNGNSGGGIYFNDSSPMLTNCILWDNKGPEIFGAALVTYCDILGGWPGEGNINADPCFVESGYWDDNGTPDYDWDDYWVEGDYHFLSDSPCIQAGDPNYVSEPDEKDLDGNPRVINGRIDMGAYEFANTDTDGDGMPDWWENKYGLNPTIITGSDGADGDCDSDGWRNIVEYLLRTEPNNSSSDGEDRLPTGWTTMEIEAKWTISEETFNTIQSDFYDGSIYTINGISYDIDWKWEGLQKLYWDFYYDNSADELSDGLHCLRKRRRFSSPYNDPDDRDYQRVQYKSDPYRYGAVWMRQEYKDDELSDHEAADIVEGDSTTWEVNPESYSTVDAVLIEHPTFDESTLASFLEVIDYRYKIDFEIDNVDFFTMSLDDVTSTYSDGSPQKFYELELEIIPEPYTTAYVEELFRIVADLGANYTLTISTTSKGGLKVPESF
jgi:parallel beta-helix repeat protein/predicted outer membrane repeat protein